jgi:hypothetical protein
MSLPFLCAQNGARPPAGGKKQRKRKRGRDSESDEEPEEDVPLESEESSVDEEEAPAPAAERSTSAVATMIQFPATTALHLSKAKKAATARKVGRS